MALRDGQTQSYYFETINKYRSMIQRKQARYLESSPFLSLTKNADEQLNIPGKLRALDRTKRDFTSQMLLSASTIETLDGYIGAKPSRDIRVYR